MTKLTDGIISANNAIGERAAARTYTRNKKLSDNVLSTLYDENWVVQKFINMISADMLRKDRVITSELVDGQDKAIERFCKDYGVFDALDEYLCFGRLYGDSLLLAITETATGGEVDLTARLNLDQERLVKFIVLDKQCYSLGDSIKDIASPNFGMPEYYDLKVADNQKIHHSRVCRLMAGKRPMSKLVKGGSQSFGISEIAAIWQPLVAYDTAKAGISDLIEECKTDIIKIKDYNLALSQGREGDFIEFAQSFKNIKSLANLGIIDQDAEWDTKELSSPWVNEALKESRIDLAGACGMPLTRMFGQSASGFASGEEDNKIYAENINGRQETDLRPAWNFIDKFMIDKLREDDPSFELSFFDYDFPSILNLSEKEEAEILKINVDSLVALFGVEAIDAVQIAREMQLKGIQSITDETIAELESVVRSGLYERPTAEPTSYSSF